LAWRVEVAAEAARDLAKLDRQIARRILAFLRQRLAMLDDPRSLGEALKGARFESLWKYRVGDYRVIASIEDGVARALVVRVGHRREIYR
jgi:mRNA interferase RelE/StbE